MKTFHPSLLIAGCALSALITTGCGGGSGEDPGTPSLSGITAIGTALSNATITLKDRQGNTRVVTSNSNGEFRLPNVSGLEVPMMIQAKGVVGDREFVLHSIITTKPINGDNTINITPATQSIAHQTLCKDPAQAFEDAKTIQAIDKTTYERSKENLHASVKPTLEKLNLDAKQIDLTKIKFKADKTGVDKLYDLIDFSVSSSCDITLTNKNSKASVTLAEPKSQVGAVPTMVVTQEDADLDLRGLKELSKKFAEAILNQKQDVLLAYLDTDFLNNGVRRTNYQNKTNADTQNVQVDETDYWVQSCEPAKKICDGSLQLKLGEVPISLEMPVKKGNDGQWRFYGNQSEFSVNFTPMYQVVKTYNSQKQETKATYKNGFNLHFYQDNCPTNDDLNCTKLLGATFRVSFDNGKSFTTLQSQKANANGQLQALDANGQLLAFDELEGSVFNMVQLTDDQAQKYMEARKNGTLKIEFQAYKQADFNNAQPMTWSPKVLPAIFANQAEASKQLETKNMTLNEKQLGTSSVGFTGKSLREALFSYQSGNSHLAYPFFFQQVNRLNGEITFDQFTSQCPTYLQVICNEIKADKTLVVQEGYLISTDSLGRNIQLYKQLK